MNATESTSIPAAGPGFGIDDLLFVLFRHKWKILILSLLGLAGAAAVYKLWSETVYRSEAKLFIRYLQESKAPATLNDDERIMSPDQRGETIVNGELEILTSMDLAKAVAVRIGPERVLRSIDGGSDLNAAAAVIRGGLTASAARGSRVVKLRFTHTERQLTAPILEVVVDEYLKKHVEIHRTASLYEGFLSKETLQLRSRLAQTEEELRKLKDKAGVISLEESKRAYAEQLSKIRQQIFDTSAELAEKKALRDAFARPEAEEEKVPAEKVREHRSLLALLDTFAKQEQELLYSYQPGTLTVQSLRGRISASEAIKAELEQAYPSLAAQSLSAASTPRPAVDERTAIRTLETRIAVLEEHLGRIRAEASELGSVELSIADVQRRKDLQEQHYRYLSTSLERSRINDTLSTGQVSNISVIQSATPPVSDVGQLHKVVGGIAGGGLAAGLVLAFGLELFVDRSVKRGRDIRHTLGLPLFLSIPRLRLTSRRPYLPRRLLARASSKDLAAANAPSGGGRDEATASVAPSLEPYMESLRNQVLQDIDLRNLTHTPRLVGVTGCETGAGVSTVAAGLAASLSKAGEGNVLLVDMTSRGPVPRAASEQSACELSHALEPGHRTEAQIAEKLYLVSGTAGGESQILPRRFANLVPRFRGSDYDYIVFDLPPVTQLTATAQFCRYMDTMVLVVEAEKTNREVVRQVTATLQDSCESVGVILNKTRSHVPLRAALEV